MTTATIPGIHHITAIAGDPQRNLDFYTSILGLRLVKLTVNFDDPGTYHLLRQRGRLARFDPDFLSVAAGAARRRGIGPSDRDHICDTGWLRRVLAFTPVKARCVPDGGG
jgi:catechol 2,3-dioxygenase-like lactoylglutathione lyase family enzyme